MLRIYNHREIYIPRSLNICIYMLSRTRSWNKRAQWAAAASVFLLFLQGISILGSKHFRVQTLPIYKKKVLINMHGPIVFVESNPNQTPQDFTENHCNNASLLLRSWWFLSTAHVARSVISKAQALLLWVLPPHGDVRWTGEKRSSFYPDSSSSSWPKKENSVIQQDLKVIEVTQIALQKNKR